MTYYKKKQHLFSCKLKLGYMFFSGIIMAISKLCSMYLVGISLSFKLHHHWCIHAAQAGIKDSEKDDKKLKLGNSNMKSSWNEIPNLQRTRDQNSHTLVLCHVFRCFPWPFNCFLLLLFSFSSNNIIRNVFIVIIWIFLRSFLHTVTSTWKPVEKHLKIILWIVDGANSCSAK